VFWIFDEVWWTGDRIATVATTGVEADFVGIMTITSTQTFINIWKIKLHIKINLT
jgi:hypothetical protein